MKLILALLIFFASLLPSRAGQDDESILTLLAKSSSVLSGTIKDEPSGKIEEAGVTIYLVTLLDSQAIYGTAVPKEVTLRVTRFENSQSDALPYLKKDRDVYFL